MASESKVDATGTVKLKTLDEALLLLQRVHGIVEQYAVAFKRGQPTSAYVMNLRRQLPSLAANLKAHFSLIADEVLALNLATSRGRRIQATIRRSLRLEGQRREEHAPSPERAVLEREQNTALSRALGRVSTVERTALLLAAQGYDGMTIAAMIGRSHTATRAMMCRARRRLRDALTELDA